MSKPDDRQSPTLGPVGRTRMADTACPCMVELFVAPLAQGYARGHRYENRRAMRRGVPPGVGVHCFAAVVKTMITCTETNRDGESKYFGPADISQMQGSLYAVALQVDELMGKAPPRNNMYTRMQQQMVGRLLHLFHASAFRSRTPKQQTHTWCVLSP